MRRPIWRTLWGLKPTAASIQNVLRPGPPWLSSVIKIFVYPIVAPGSRCIVLLGMCFMPVWPGEPSHNFVKILAMLVWP